MKQRLQLAMAKRRQEERVRKAELNRLDNEDCGEEEEEEEEEDMTDESEEEEVRGCLFLSAEHCGLKQSNYLRHFCASMPFVLTSSLIFSLNQGVDDLLGGDDGEQEEEEEEEGSVAQSIRSPSGVALNRPSPTPELVNTDDTLMLFPGNSCSRTG